MVDLVEFVDEDREDDGDYYGREEGYRSDGVEWYWRIVGGFDGFGPHDGRVVKVMNGIVVNQSINQSVDEAFQVVSR